MYMCIIDCVCVLRRVCIYIYIQCVCFVFKNICIIQICMCVSSIMCAFCDVYIHIQYVCCVFRNTCSIYIHIYMYHCRIYIYMYPCRIIPMFLLFFKKLHAYTCVHVYKRIKINYSSMSLSSEHIRNRS